VIRGGERETERGERKRGDAIEGKTRGNIPVLALVLQKPTNISVDPNGSQPSTANGLKSLTDDQAYSLVYIGLSPKSAFL
jgi:hypothetical protein